MIVHTLCNHLLLELSSDLFNALQIFYRHIRIRMKKFDDAEKGFGQTDRRFNLAIF